MSANDLLTVFSDAVPRSPNFFNGRLLSAEVLRDEHDFNREHQQRLGQALGAGVVAGLAVSATTESASGKPALLVTKGLALNREGSAIQLYEDKLVPLTRPQTTMGAVDRIFIECEPPQAGNYTPNAGLYVFTISPAQGTQGRAPVSGLGNTTADCNARYRVEGVHFRLIQLDIPDLGNLDTLRNRIAYECFGVPEREAFPTDPFGSTVTAYGRIDKLRQNGLLAECEVPLAIIYWNNDGLQWVDMWSVRRRVTHTSADTNWPLLVSDRRLAEGEAMFLQFQDQVMQLLFSGASHSQTIAQQLFECLPPVGILPISTNGAVKGFDYSKFFSQMTYRKPIFIEGAQLSPLLQEAFNYPPIETKSKLVVWLYLVRENAQATLSSPKPPMAALVFASGHIPYRGEARYNVNRWNFGNYS